MNPAALFNILSEDKVKAPVCPYLPKIPPLLTECIFWMILCPVSMDTGIRVKVIYEKSRYFAAAKVG